MNKQHLLQNDKLYQYLLDISVRENEIQKALREATMTQVAQSQMMTSVEQAQFLGFLVKLIGARRAIEVGVFTGYGSLAIAQALPEKGLLIGCDISSEWPALGEPFWKQANVYQKIQMKYGPALQSLKNLLEQGEANTFDFIFIDADKSNYWNYYDIALQLVRPGGLIAVDNCLWVGGAAVYEAQNDSMKAIHHFNQRVHQDERVTLSLVPVGSGMLLARKNEN